MMHRTFISLGHRGGLAAVHPFALTDAGLVLFKKISSRFARDLSIGVMRIAWKPEKIFSSVTAFGRYHLTAGLYPGIMTD